MAIVTKGSGGSIKFTGTGGSLSITSSGGGGGGGGGGSPIDPSSLGDLKLRFLGDSLVGSTWNATSPGSTLARVYDASGNPLTNAGAPSFNGHTSAYIDAFTANNYDSGTFLDIPGGSTARTLYMVAHVPDVSAGTNPTRMFGYGSFNSSYSTVGFVLSDGYIYGSAELVSSPPMNLVGDGASTKGAPISSATTFVVSYSYAAGSDLKDNPIYVNGVLGTYGVGKSGVINSDNNGSGIIGSTAPNLAFEYKYNYRESTAPGAPFYVADLLIFNTEHDSSTRAGVESWLMTQYGIS